MTTYYRNEYLFSEIYLQEITQQPEDTEILASLTKLKEYREFARTSTILEWKESFVHEVLYALRFGIKSENERLTVLYPVGDTETPITLCYVLLPTEDLDNTTMGRNWAEKVIGSRRALWIPPPEADGQDTLLAIRRLGITSGPFGHCGGLPIPMEPRLCSCTLLLCRTIGG